MGQKKYTQTQQVIDTLRKYGGYATLGNLYHLVDTKSLLIINSSFCCLESFLMMLEDGELHYQPKPIEEGSDLDNEANKTLAYDELVKEVEGEEQGARGLAYDDTIHEYVDKRTEQLKERATFEELINKVALYESELLDYAGRLLSDDPLNADSETAIGTLDMLDDEAIDLFKSVDVDNEYQGLEYYNTSLNKED